MCPLFVQFSVHFLFFTCLFFYYKKILHLFHLLFLTLLARNCIFFCFVLCRAIPVPGTPRRVSSLGQHGCDQRKRGRPLPVPRKTGSTPHTHRSMGFCWFACVCDCFFFYGCVSFCLFECRLFSLHLYTYVTFL